MTKELRSWKQSGAEASLRYFCPVHRLRLRFTQVQLAEDKLLLSERHCQAAGVNLLRASRFWRHICVGDAIMPAKFVLIQHAPGKSQSEGQSRQQRSQHAPAPESSRYGLAVEPAQSQLHYLQTRSCASMHQKKVLIGDPKNSGNKHAPASRLGQRRHD